MAGWACPTHATVSASQEQTLTVFTHAHVSMITYRVHVYRSRPTGASQLTTSPQQGCVALKGLHTGWLGVVTGIRLIQMIAAATAERHRGLIVLCNIGYHFNS